MIAWSLYPPFDMLCVQRQNYLNVFIVQDLMDVTVFEGLNQPEKLKSQLMSCVEEDKTSQRSLKVE